MNRKPWRTALVLCLAAAWFGAGASDPTPATEAARRRAALEVQRGRAALVAGNLKKAEARFRRALALDETSPDALVGVGEIRMHRLEFHDALDAFLHAESEYRARFESGDDLYRGRHQDGMAAAVELRHRANTLRYNIDRLEASLDGAGTGDTGRRPEMVRNYRQEVAALEREADRLESSAAPNPSADEPVPGELYCAIGNARLRLSRLDDAVTAWTRCAEICPEIAWVHNNLAAAYLRLGRPVEALHHLDRAEQLGFETHPNLRREIERAHPPDAPPSNFR